MSGSHDTGVQGEALAIDFLERNGYTIREQNWRHEKAEIDLIAEKDGVLVFVEVKTRSTGVFLKPEDAVGAIKQRHLRKGAEAYLLQSEFDGEVRFDILSIILHEKETQIRHIEDVFFQD